MSAEATLAAIRALWWLLPAGLAVGLWLARPPSPRERAGMLVAVAWCLPALLALNVAAPRLGWWQFQVSGGEWMGVPVDALLGWVLLWGVLPHLALPRAPVWVIALAALWLDALTMPLCAPALELAPGWLVGECVALAMVLIPAQCAARWTRDARRLAARVGFQVACFSALALWVIPAIAFAQTGGGWGALFGRSSTATALLLQCLAVPGVLALAGVLEFYRSGRGTPLPFDPPLRLVARGPYRYVRNPMQLGMTLVLAIWALALESVAVGAAAGMGVLFSAGLAAWHEDLELEARFGEAWRAYRADVPAWRPRWRPAVFEPATLYYAAGCGPCEGLAGWLRERAPAGLELIPAQEFPGPLPERLTYVAGDSQESGVDALARALEHLHFAWAMLGFALRLPGIAWGVQLLVDASGGEPQRLERQSTGALGARASLRIRLPGER